MNHSGLGVPYRVKTKIPRTGKITPAQKFAEIGAKNKTEKSHYRLGSHHGDFAWFFHV